jgi:fumarylacetoacetase
VSGACQQLDFEVEFALIVGQGSSMGSSIDVDKAEDHVFGVVLLNDWSARDIQLWESTLVGPFNGKNFCTTISPWIIPLEALEPFRIAPKKPVCY